MQASPIQQISCSYPVRLFIKRDDQLLLPAYPGDLSLSGNKCRKLKYNLPAAREAGHDSLLTFGGAYSNHLAATASAGRIFGFRTIGIVRGDPWADNPTLRHARACGMELHFIDRSSYRRRREPALLEELLARFGPAYVLPEGGTNTAALRGCAALAEEINDQLETPADYYCLACGTGGTLAGLTAGLNGRGKVLGFPALRGGDFLRAEISALLEDFSGVAYDNWDLITEYHFGGYARTSDRLLAFIREFRGAYGIGLEPIYTGKLFFGIFDLLEKGFFPPGSVVVGINTGGMQGFPDCW